MDHDTKVALCGGISGLTAFFSLYPGKLLNDTQQKIEQHPAYGEVLILDHMCSLLTYAEGALSYDAGSSHRPGHQPHPIDARTNIETVLKYLGDSQKLDDQLREIHDSLPNEGHMEGYQNKRVDYLTFQPQRERLGAIHKELATLSETKIPLELKEERMKYGLMTLGFFLTSLFLLGYLVFGLREKEDVGKG